MNVLVGQILDEEGVRVQVLVRAGPAPDAFLRRPQTRRRVGPPSQPRCSTADLAGSTARTPDEHRCRPVRQLLVVHRAPQYLKGARQVVPQHGPLCPLIKNALETSRKRRGGPITITTPSVPTPEQRHDTYLPPARDQRGAPINPRLLPNWRPGDLEWSAAVGRVISVR